MLISSDDEVLPVVPSAVAGAVTASRGDFVGRAVHRRTRRIECQEAEAIRVARGIGRDQR